MRNGTGRNDAYYDAYYDAYRGVRVLVLGASGFIGRWVARSLTHAGADIHLAVRDADKAVRIFHVYGVRGTVHSVDLTQGKAVHGLFQQVRPAVSFNLAGYGVDPNEQVPSVAEAINARLPDQIARAAYSVFDTRWHGCHLLHVGSALEYGDSGGNLAETTVPDPITEYGRTKLAGTRRFTEVCKEIALPGVTARAFTAYGPGEHAGRLLPALRSAARKQIPVDLSEGHQRRDFTYVADVAMGLLRRGIIQTGLGEIVNLARGQLTTVREFAQIAARVLGISPRRLRFGVIPTREEEMDHNPVCVERLRELTQWLPPNDIESGVAHTRDFA